MEILDFRFLTLNDYNDTRYECWSRIFEYPYVLNKLKELGANKSSKIHNTSWGFLNWHIRFKDDLDKEYENCIHSDIRTSNLVKTMYYDITKSIEDKYKNYFDFVINVSTIEEVPFDNIKIINNLLEQVKPGGYLIVTFDYDKNNCNTYGNGSMNLDEIEQFINRKIIFTEDMINGNNSPCRESHWSNLNCGVLIIKK